MARKNDSKTYTDASGKFAEGNPGKPKGARHKVTLAVEALLSGQAEALTESVIAKALEGDVTALRLCLERIAPVRKDVPVNFKLPDIHNAKEASEAAKAVLRAVSEGEISPLEGTAIMGLIEQFRRVLETTEIEARIEALENANDAE